MTKPGTEGVVVHIKSGPGSQDDRHRVGMALSFALKALDSDRKVLVFFDTNGANIPLAEAESFSYEAGERQFPDTRETITRLVREGATVMVCPACLQAEGHEMEDLIAGVQPGNIDKFFEFTDGRILTMDW